MAPELSSNWKKLQAKIKTELPASAPASGGKSAASTKPTAQKRKASDASARAPKQTKKPRVAAASKPTRTQPPKQMGVTQSSTVTKGTAATITPSLALWAEDNDISPEALAEAYNLGGPPPPPRPRGAASSSRTKPGLPAPLPDATDDDDDAARVNEGLAPSSLTSTTTTTPLGKYVGLDCEMVGVGPEPARASALARVSAVDFHGAPVYDAYVRPREPVTDYRTPITGITAATLRRGAGARPFAEARAAVAALLRGRVLVGHDLRHDLAALELAHPDRDTRDTARFAGYRGYGHGRRPALRVLAREVLGLEIQAGAHSSVEDARVAMLLFRHRKSDFDVQHASKYGAPPEDGVGRSETGKETKKKKKGKKKKGKGKKAR
ncbi:ribonuclease H-like domain-containing protein [Xylariomycetidae sp. FL0641]|nr:ribonuclease H-like domain-containing protein [Xylariomycetidae sp. FL0641]